MSTDTPRTDAEHIAVIQKYYTNTATVITDCGHSIRYVLERLAAEQEKVKTLREALEGIRDTTIDTASHAHARATLEATK